MPTPEVLTSVINSYLPEPHASLLNGILFGINLKTSKEFYSQLKIVGLLHIVVLSGMNITLIASIIANLTLFLGRLSSTLITILVIILFVAFVGAKAPVVRASVMGILTSVAIIYGRKNLALFSLLISGIISIVIWPHWLTSLSFLLSYGATLGIILFGSVMPVQTNSMKQALRHTLWKELKPSLAAQLFSIPIIFFSFKQVSLIAPFSNLLIAFTIGPIMIFGFLAAFLGKVHFLLGLAPAYICYALLSYVIFIIQTLSKLPFIFFQF